MAVQIDKKIFLSLCILTFGILISTIILQNALAQNSLAKKLFPDFEYPIAELGNCKNADDCRTYCDKPENLKACLDFADKHDLLPEEEIDMAKKFAAAGGKGPGGCIDQDSCETYCNDMTHMDECIAFAERTGIMPRKELEEAKRIQAALARGAQMPGSCRNKDECEIYCSDPDHTEECIEFAIAAGIMPPDEVEEAKKVLTAVKKGVKPPPCKGKRECDDYCNKIEHMEECMKFAKEAGLIPPEEADEMDKVLKAIKKGAKPPPCRGKEECDEWCAESDEHMNQCMEFAVAAGFMSEKDAEMAKKTGGKGPGGCKGKEQCDTFCQNPANQETCFQFGLEHGLIPEEDLKNMEKGKQEMMKGLEQAPPEVAECLKETVGTEILEKIRSGTFMPSRELGEGMRQCFEKVMREMGPPQGMPPNGMPKGEIPGAPQAGTHIILKNKGSSNFEVIITNPSGIKEFSFQPTSGSRYSGGLSGCPKEYKTLTVFDMSGFPLETYVIDCEDNKDEFSISGEGNYKTGGGGPDDYMMPQEVMLMPKNMGGPGGCQTPEECDKYCREHMEECMQLKPEGMMPPGEKESGIFERMKEFGGRVIERLKPNEEEQLERIPPEMQSSLIEKMTPEMVECLRSAIGDEMVEKMKAGELPPMENLGEKMRPCTEMYKTKVETIKMPPSEFGIEPKFEGEEGFIDREEMQLRIQENPMERLREYKEEMERQYMEGAERQYMQEMMPHEQMMLPEEIMAPPEGLVPSINVMLMCDFNKDGKIDESEKIECEKQTHTMTQPVEQPSYVPETMPPKDVMPPIEMMAPTEIIEPKPALTPPPPDQVIPSPEMTTETPPNQQLPPTEPSPTNMPSIIIPPPETQQLPPTSFRERLKNLLFGLVEKVF